MTICKHTVLRELSRLYEGIIAGEIEVIAVSIVLPQLERHGDVVLQDRDFNETTFRWKNTVPYNCNCEE